MVKITTHGAYGYCPHLDMYVTLSGKYKFIDKHKSIFTGSFKCPIAENAKQPIYDQCEEYEYLLPCNEILNCPIAKNFKKEITY